MFFGVRSAVPTHGNDKRSTAVLDGSSLYDHHSYRCTLMQWYRQSGQLAAFKASTVPNRGFIANAQDDGGKGANIMASGCYPFVKGSHPRSGDPVTQKAFREPDGSPKLVLRTADDLQYEWVSDLIEIGNVFDNIHAGGANEPFSSAGCQVIQGSYTAPGHWRTFRQRAYEIDQSRFRYLLLPASVWKSWLGDPEAPRIVVGSRGDRARLVQQKLIERGYLASGGADGDFGPISGRALLRFQRSASNTLAADAICGLETARALGITTW